MSRLSTHTLQLHSLRPICVKVATLMLMVRLMSVVGPHKHTYPLSMSWKRREVDATYCHMPAERNGAVCAPLCATQYSLFVRLRTQRATQRAFIYEIKSGTLADRRGSAGCALPGPTDKAQPQAMCDLTVVRPLSFFTAFFFHESYMHTNRKQMQRSL